MHYNIIYFVKFNIPTDPLWSLIIGLTYTAVCGLPFWYFFKKELQFFDLKKSVGFVLFKSCFVSLITGGLVTVLYFYIGIIQTETVAWEVFSRFIVGLTLFYISTYIQITYFSKLKYYWFEEKKYNYDLISSKETDKHFKDYFDKLRQNIILEREKKIKKLIKILMYTFGFLFISFSLFTILVIFLMFW
jgi:hypothetical protein